MKIGVYMDTGGKGTPLGGTEYSAAVIAEELAKRFEVELVHHRERAEKAEFLSLFGTDLSAVRFRFVEKQPMTFGTSKLPWRRLRQARAWHAEVSKPYDYFIAFIHLIPPYCHAPRGMFTILFPFVDRQNTWPWAAPNGSANVLRKWVRGKYFESEWTSRIDSYDVKASNSYFTSQWVLKRYGAVCQVHYPPSQALAPAAQKKNEIISVGRFSVFKNQLELMSAFRQLPDLAEQGWRFRCAGAVDETHAEGRMYFDAVRSFTEDGRADVLANMDLPDLRQLYQEAKIFWHAAGYPYDQNVIPHVMEHFGIVTVEAMSAGCVPVVINKGGQPEIVEHGVNGFLWNTLEELKGYTCLLAKDEKLRNRMAAAAVERSRLFSTSQYIKRLYELVPDLRPRG